VFFDLRLSECEPTDFLGVPRDIDHFIVYKPLRWVRVFSYEQSAGLIFLDEITNVRREDVLAQAYKLVLDRRAGLRKFSDGVRVVAAGNHPEHSSIANLLPAPLANRFAIITIDATDPYEWLEYVNSKEGGIDPRVAGYIARFPGDLLQKSDAETLENFPTPRSWSRLNQILLRKSDIDFDEIEEVARMLLGSATATKFAAFCRLRDLLPPPEKILGDPDSFFNKFNKTAGDGTSKIDLLYYAVSTVASYVSTTNRADWKQVINFVVRLAKVHADLFVVFAKLLPKQMRGSLVIDVAKIKEVQQVATAISKYI
jgi:hypothetical protein